MATKPNACEARIEVFAAIMILSCAACISGEAYPAQGQPRLAITILDEITGEPTPVRVRMTTPDGKPADVPAVGIAVMWGRSDVVDGYEFQPDGSFYVDGPFEMELEPDLYTISISKGFEYLEQRHEILLEPGDDVSRTYELARWIDMPSRGWYSADDHIHIRRSPRENPLILRWIAAEDIHVGALLRMGDFWRTYFEQYAFGKEGLYRENDNILTSGQEEPRTHEIGHTISLAADGPVRFQQNYYYYDQLFDRVHELDGLTGYAHQGVSFHGYRGMTMDVLQGKLDFLELLQFCVADGPLHTENYYHFLDLGYKLTATAGSDFPWCGRIVEVEGQRARRTAHIGNVRFYTYVGDEFSFDAWKASFKSGHTFVSSGPMIDFKINGKLPGDTLDVKEGDTLKITAHAYGDVEQTPLQTLEIVAHGKVIREASATQANQSPAELSVEFELPVERGVWIAARCHGDDDRIAHTTPIYVTVDGGGFHNPETAARKLDLCEDYLEELAEVIGTRHERVDYNAWRYREGLEKRIAETLEIIAGLREELK